MKILVAVKPVIDVQLKVRLENGRVDESLDKVINAWDEHALEAALQIKESAGGEVTAVTLGAGEMDAFLRKALAMGADSAVSIDFEEAKLNSFNLALILGKLFVKREFDLLIMGKQAQDFDLGKSCHFASRIYHFPCYVNLDAMTVQEGKIKVKSISETGAREFEVETPAILTVSDSLNVPRLAGPRGIMLAKKKPVEKIPLSDLDLDGEALPFFEGDFSFAYSLYENEKDCRMFEGKPREAVDALSEVLAVEKDII